MPYYSTHLDSDDCFGFCKGKNESKTKPKKTTKKKPQTPPPPTHQSQPTQLTLSIVFLQQHRRHLLAEIRANPTWQLPLHPRRGPTSLCARSSAGNNGTRNQVAGTKARRRIHCWERVPLCPPGGQIGIREQQLPPSQLGSQELLGHRPRAATGLQGSFQKPHEAASCISPPPTE